MCEKCWSDAYLRMMLRGGSQADHYFALVREREEDPCTPEQQRGEQAHEEEATDD